MKDYFTLKIPSFIPSYKSNILYGYKNAPGRNLSELLYQTSNGYCMYCYSKIEVDSKRFGQLEHAIEKKHSTDLLENCVPNIGLSCPKCNLSFKKTDDEQKIFTKVQIIKFESCICKKGECKSQCKEYKTLKKSYLKKRNIILQPMGVNINRRELKIQYNLLKLIFEPCSDIAYSNDEKKFITNHIAQFNLNDAKYRTRELLLFCEDVINQNTYFEKKRYNNLIVDLFIDNIKPLSQGAITKLCSIIYTIGRAQHLI